MHMVVLVVLPIYSLFLSVGGFLEGNFVARASSYLILALVYGIIFVALIVVDLMFATCGKASRRAHISELAKGTLPSATVYVRDTG
jgi:hypothetical protein